ncbi:MAG: YraN family protein [Lachnospiraceae bacterium]|nr:YraN family protein [Lachnospiraceae bacterium]
MKENNTRKIGKEKEDLAVSYLEKKGYQILERNFFMRGGEIDIIASGESTIIFVEVKYRNTVKHGTPEEAVTYQKQLRIAKTALYYIKKRNIPLESSFRFDVIVISGTSVSWIMNAFDFPEALGF